MLNIRTTSKGIGFFIHLLDVRQRLAPDETR